MFKLRIFIIVSIVAINLIGCAINYVDRNGAQHTWGLVHIIDKEQFITSEEIANLHQVSTFGLYYLSMKQNASIGIGYINAYEISVSENEAVEISLDTSHPQTFEIKTFNSIIKENKADVSKNP